MPESTPVPPKQLEREVLLHRITHRIRQSLELNEILATTATEVRAVLGTDRVMVYRFREDGSGKAIAESLGSDRLPSLRGLSFPADDIPDRAREMFVKLRVRSVVDRQANSIARSPFMGEQVGDTEDRTLDPCHREYLSAMGVASSLVVPILVDRECTTDDRPDRDLLWGLLVSHHSQPQEISPIDIELVQMVADRVSLAITQSNLLERTRAQSRRDTTVTKIATLLHAQPSIELQAALEGTVNALGGIGGRLFLAASGHLVCWGEQPKLSRQSQLEVFWSQWDATQSGDRIHAIDDLYVVPQLNSLVPAFLATSIRTLLVLPLQYRQHHLGYLSVFRAEIETERLWAGRFNPNEKQQRPRKSFETWCEKKTAQTQPWTRDEIELAQALGEQFSMAVEQYQLYQQVKSLNATLELQVRERTAKLKQALRFSQLRKEITERIRSTLNIPTILSAIVREVGAVLNVDRVAIYQLDAEGSGEVTVEEVRGKWKSVLGQTEPAECFPDESARTALRGRVRAIEDTSDESIAPCHREFLQSLQVKANLTIPIRHEWNAQLWGLLILHQCSSTRVWQPAEIELLQQLANQAAIAIGQAQLYEQSKQATTIARSQAQRAQEALEELKHAQTQLIQSEKMSSLGELVAGVAHEINNPVNFIYGNALHCREYIENLLEMVQLYRDGDREPDEAIEEFADRIDYEFLVEDLPKTIASMKMGAERIRRIVLSLRNFSRLDIAKKNPANIHEGIDNTLLILQYRLKANANRCEIQVIKDYGDLPLVECYVGQINQVFMNTIGNGIEAIEEAIDRGQCHQPTLQIRTRMREKAWAIVEITDNGSGIPESVRSRIFNPFFTTKPPGVGTGLGLSIGWQIVVEKHGGKFECHSQPGMGTTFRVEIPIQAKAREQKSAISGQLPISEGERSTSLYGNVRES
ncbi:MAG: GAF domain-containing protein [Cyanobacteriota bacterium]|nr:GAF domain-containing protein [Cyanobacteriota bacterium]